MSSYLAITAHTSVARHLELNDHSYFIRVVLLSPVVSDTRQDTRTSLSNTAMNPRHGSIQSGESCDGLYHHRRGSAQALCIPILAWQPFVRLAHLVVDFRVLAFRAWRVARGALRCVCVY